IGGITVSGILPGTLYEYVPEELTLYELNIQNGSFFYEEWESNAAFNIIFCMFRECRRNYLNNVFLTSFEVGCCCQNLQLVTSSLGFGSCISGIININEFYSYFKELVPLQSISIFKVKNDN
ncbi:hypothetical protein, partial [Aeromonas jandaei]|uniref:hypothetical protein n=1 Tax=Aeromonas jandaei TaxID=650 RepID=UPI00195D7CB7